MRMLTIRLNYQPAACAFNPKMLAKCAIAASETSAHHALKLTAAAAVAMAPVAIPKLLPLKIALRCWWKKVEVR
jgi:hypothetical protein